MWYTKMIEKIYIKSVKISEENIYATVVINDREIEFVKVKEVFFNRNITLEGSS